jgi:hypothetical protein
MERQASDSAIGVGKQHLSAEKRWMGSVPAEGEMTP